MATKLDAVIKRLEAVERTRGRRDFKTTAKMARELLERLTDKTGAPDRLKFLAEVVAEKAAERPILGYTTKKTEELRWISADAKRVDRIPQEQRVGVYDAGADYRSILEDLAA